MPASEALAAASVLLATAALALRLLLRARRRRGLPELLLGLSLLCGAAFGSGLEVAAPGAGASPEHAAALLAVAKLSALLGTLAGCCFVWWVFGRHDARGLLGVLGIGGLQLAGLLGQAGSGAFRTGVLDPRWLQVELLGRLAAAAWLGTEAFLYWRATRLRAAIGLADPLLANRFLLWTLAAGAAGLCLLGSLGLAQLPPGDSLREIALVLFAAGGLASAACHGLACFPPPRYRRRIGAGAGEPAWRGAAGLVPHDMA